MSTTDGNNDQCGANSGEITSNKEKCTSCEQNNVDTITKGIDSMGVSDMSTCAACGKEGNSDDMNNCNKCMMVKYCNAACKKKHRKKHKKACEKRVAELHEEALFKEPPPREECPICMLPLPINDNLSMFKSCCGKLLCSGCINAMVKSGGADLCAFCRTPRPSSEEEEIKRTNKLIGVGNTKACLFLAAVHANGRYGMPQNRVKANELYLKAGELGCFDAYNNLGNSYHEGWGVERDMKKAKHYYELAAMNGNVPARHNLGIFELRVAGNYERAFKHWVIAARAGNDGSLDKVKRGYKGGLITKDEYADILRAYQVRQEEMKSDEREEAAKVRAAMGRRGFRS